MSLTHRDSGCYDVSDRLAGTETEERGGSPTSQTTASLSESGLSETSDNSQGQVSTYFELYPFIAK